MATADFELTMTVNGEKEDLLSILNVLKRYDEGEKGVYFSSIEINKNEESVNIDEIDDDEMEFFATPDNTPLTISAIGPYGHYGELNDVDIFRDIAEAAPEAYFEAEITGNTTYTVQSLNCELKDKILHIKTYFESNEEGPEAYIQYVLKLLPYNKFIDLFKVKSDDFDEDSYSEFIDDVSTYQDECFIDMEYDEFMENLNAYSADSELDEDEYEEIINSLQELNIRGYYEFMEDYDAGTSEELDYDPIAKSYIGNQKNIFKSNQAYNVTDIMKDSLRKKGLPCDDEAVSKLSLEEAYSLIAEIF